MKHHIITVLSYWKRAWDSLLHFPIFHTYPPNKNPLINIWQESLKSYHYEYDSSSISDSDINEARECSVCLCKVEQGDEVRELRCEHVFHGECLDRWMGYRHATCPVCRDCLAPPRSINELGMEILEFKYLSFVSGRERDTWWLR